MILAFDDTDDLDGGCSTHLVFWVLLTLPELALRSMPRLVRLNPNAPHKTRGNAAIVLDLGFPEGPETQVGELLGRKVLAFPESRSAPITDEIVDRVWAMLQKQSRPGADPGLVASNDPPLSAWYWAGVRTLIENFEVPEGIVSRGGRGRIGALCAAAWPGPASSYEWIAYRMDAQVGTPRQVPAEPWRIGEQIGDTERTFDGERFIAAPHTPCPVLMGLRGRDPERLLAQVYRAGPEAFGEEVQGWMLFATNQMSGDHVTPVQALSEVEGEGWTLSLDVTLQDAATWGAGGHVQVHAKEAEGANLTLWAFEPTKAFRHQVAELQAGDKVHVEGTWKDGNLHLEAFTLLEAVPRYGEPSDCACGARRKSMGGGMDRCPACGSKAPRGTLDVELGQRVSVPVDAMRHLHR